MKTVLTVMTVFFWGLAIALAPAKWLACGCPGWRPLIEDTEDSTGA